MGKIPIGILGATGIVGQQYLKLLENHPWFEVVFLAASDFSSKKTYREAVAEKWQLETALDSSFAQLILNPVDAIDVAKRSCRFVFCALNQEVAQSYEERYAENGIGVLSNSSCHRRAADIPVVIPEINAQHLQIIPFQQKKRNWKEGFIVSKPNCSLQSFMIPLAPLHEYYHVEKLVVTTLQAVSGAGLQGVSSLQILDNVIPYIAHEEEKLEWEPLKIWGRLEKEGICPTEQMTIAAHCNRVPVVNGHMACVSIKFKKRAKKEEILTLWKNFQSLPHQLKLPHAPATPIVYQEENDRPQPRKDRLWGNGMSVAVGRLRECPVFDFRFTALTHNTIRGAAGGGILTAELIAQLGYLGKP